MRLAMNVFQWRKINSIKNYAILLFLFSQQLPTDGHIYLPHRVLLHTYVLSIPTHIPAKYIHMYVCRNHKNEATKAEAIGKHKNFAAAAVSVAKNSEARPLYIQQRPNGHGHGHTPLPPHHRRTIPYPTTPHTGANAK